MSRAENKNTEKNFEKLMTYLCEGHKISNAEICDMLGCNRQSVFNYLERVETAIKGTDTQLVKEKEGRTVYYYLSNSTQTSLSDSVYTPMTLDVIRKYTLARVIQKVPLTAAELLDHFDFGQDTFKYENDTYSLDIQRTASYELINELIDSAEFRESPTDKKLHLSGNTIPLCITVNDSEMMDITNLFESLPPNSAYYKPLLSVYRKLQLQLGMPDADSPNYDNYLIYGRQHTSMAEIPKPLLSIFKQPYTTNVLSLSYRKKDGTSMAMLFAIGLIIYSEEKDLFYLIGRRYIEQEDTFAPDDTVLLAASIEAVKKTKVKHSLYNSAQYQQMYREMFSISTQAPEKVIVRFAGLSSIERKIKNLMHQRPDSSLRTETDESGTEYLVYTDIVRGLDDFAAYLRQFGRAAVVIEPASLREKMIHSFDRSLAAYREEVTNELY